MSATMFPEVEGPMQYHLYIGFAEADGSNVRSDIARLEKLGLKIFPRSDADQPVTPARISEGTCSSQKCLLYVSEEYSRDPLHDVETKAVLAKATSFTRDVLIAFAELPDFGSSALAGLRDFVQRRPQDDDDAAWLEFAKDVAKG